MRKLTGALSQQLRSSLINMLALGCTNHAKNGVEDKQTCFTTLMCSRLRISAVCGLPTGLTGFVTKWLFVIHVKHPLFSSTRVADELHLYLRTITAITLLHIHADMSLTIKKNNCILCPLTFSLWEKMYWFKQSNSWSSTEIGLDIYIRVLVQIQSAMCNRHVCGASEGEKNPVSLTDLNRDPSQIKLAIIVILFNFPKLHWIVVS